MYAGYREEGDVCPEQGCKGLLKYSEVEGCSCHISPPCRQCVTNPLACESCGWTDESEPEYRDIPVVPGLASREFKPRPLSTTEIDYRSRPHSGCSMLKIGVYPEGTTRAEVEAKVKGTFGGRFDSFGGGKFQYVAYTD